MGTSFPARSILLLGAWVLAVAAAAGGETLPPAVRAEQFRAEFADRLRELDSPIYETRCRAAQRIDQWVADPAVSDLLADRLQRLLVQPELPMEVRWRVVLWRKQLPVRSGPLPESTSPNEIERLADQLDDDSQSVRLGASARLRWLAGSDRHAAPILGCLGRRLADPLISADLCLRIEDIRKIAWGVLLESDAPCEGLPQASSALIEQWLHDVSRPGARLDRDVALRCRIARQCLMDAMTRDDQAPAIASAIRERLRGKLDADAARLLNELFDLTRPALAVEGWRNRVPVRSQHFFVGVPTQVGKGAKPTHFDRIDDRTAHCASGNALIPGDYPVGVAFSVPGWNPSLPEEVFVLVNLPTPRRQIAYRYAAKSDPAVRLARLSRRTLDGFLAAKKTLNDPELGMLGHLDAREVSRFANRYLLLVDDQSVAEDPDTEYSTSRRQLGMHSSLLMAVCGQLAIDGTRDAAPGLLEAIRQRRFLPPSPLGPYRLQWLAAFAIAHRDPWPEVDAWLAETLENRETIINDHSDGAEVGATAAGLLLARHRRKPEDFGLQPARDARMQELKLAGYRYRSEEDAQRVRDWYRKEIGQPERTPVGAAR